MMKLLEPWGDKASFEQVEDNISSGDVQNESEDIFGLKNLQEEKVMPNYCSFDKENQKYEQCSLNDASELYVKKYIL